ncbi:MAG TPA: hypothetical protein VH477_19315 [Bryobacteraceae bacterium]|jgi:plastocyanin
MIWRSAICFNLLLWVSALPAATVSGRVELASSRESSVRKGKDYSGIAVWLEPAKDDPIDLPRMHAAMLQKEKKFTPHILVISRGSTVDFPNHDPIYHSAFSNFEGQIFDIALYPPGTSRSVRFNRAGIVRVFCNIHPAMSAVIVVVDTPFYAITGESGEFSIPNVAPGEYTLHFFHERATPETLARLTEPVTVDQPDIMLSATTISEAGYLPVAHKNKYGRVYRTPADEEHPY